MIVRLTSCQAITKLTQKTGVTNTSTLTFKACLWTKTEHFSQEELMRAISKFQRSPLMIHSEISKFSKILLPYSFLFSLREAVLNSSEVFVLIFLYEITKQNCFIWNKLNISKKLGRDSKPLELFNGYDSYLKCWKFVPNSLICKGGGDMVHITSDL